jgi:hypothetical protein
MADFADAVANAMLDDYLGSRTWYLAAYVGDPMSGGSEVTTSGTAYARQGVTFAAAGSRVKATNSAATWAVATAAYGTVSHLALFAAGTGGSPLMSHALTGGSMAVNAGGQLEVASGAFTAGLT